MCVSAFLCTAVVERQTFNGTSKPLHRLSSRDTIVPQSFQRGGSEQSRPAFNVFFFPGREKRAK